MKKFSPSTACADFHATRLLSRRSVLAVGLSAALFLGGLALAGHPASSGGALFGIADWLHLVAVATWLGTLPGFFVLVGRLRGRDAARTEIGMSRPGTSSVTAPITTTIRAMLPGLTCMLITTSFIRDKIS